MALALTHNDGHPRAQKSLVVCQAEDLPPKCKFPIVLPPGERGTGSMDPPPTTVRLGTTKAPQCVTRLLRGDGVCMRSKEYRAKGAACFLAAKHSTSLSERMSWLSMADIWLKLAEMVERHAPPLLEEDEPYHRDQRKRLAS
jgi:hypothetical protein